MIVAAAAQDVFRPAGEVFGNEISLTPEGTPGFIDRAAGNVDREARDSG